MRFNCYGYYKDTCVILNPNRQGEYSCDSGKVCSFFKTPDEAKLALEKSNKNMSELSLKLQSYISDKYYDGQIPWAEV